MTYVYDSDIAIPDPAGQHPEVLSTNYPKGRLVQLGNDNSTTVYRYDAAGRVRSSAQTTDGQIYRFGYDHNWIGLKSIRYPSTRLVSYGYDGGGRVNQVGGYASGIQYAPHGAVSQMTLGNSLVETTGFNTRLQPASIAAGSLLSLGYGYGTGASNNGNLISQTITASGHSYTQSYSYDGFNRLAGASEGPAWSRAFGYDAYGNMWVESGSGVPVDSFTARSASAYDRRTGASGSS